MAISKAMSTGNKPNEIISVIDFGAVGDGVTDDATALTNAIAYCQSTRQNLYLGPYHYAINSKVTISGSSPITIIGEVGQSWQNGSSLPASALIWTGGADAMIDLQTTYCGFIGFAVENHGTATDFINIATATAQGLRLEKMSFVNGTGHTRFSRSTIHCTNNYIGYSVFKNIVWQGAAPKFIDIDGNGTSNGITPIYIGGERSLFESNGSNDCTIIYIKDETLDALTIENCTFNQQTGELTVIDTTDTPTSRTIDVLTFEKNEFDINTSVAGDRMMKLENVQNARFNGNHFQGGGTITALIDLTTSNVTSFEGNYARSINGPVFSTDATSLVSGIGQNTFDVSNTRGIVDSSTSGPISMTYGATTYIEGHKAQGQGHSCHEVEVTDANAWTLSYRNPTSGYLVPGQIITVIIKNTSGGAIATPTLAGTIETTGAMTMPADTKNRSFTFVWNGSNFYEIARGAGDVNNT